MCVGGNCRYKFLTWLVSDDMVTSLKQSLEVSKMKLPARLPLLHPLSCVLQLSVWHSHWLRAQSHDPVKLIIKSISSNATNKIEKAARILWYPILTIFVFSNACFSWGWRTSSSHRKVEVLWMYSNLKFQNFLYGTFFRHRHANYWLAM